MRFGKRQINLRSEMAIWGAVTAIALTLALTMISVVTITRHIERDSRDDVAILANDVAEAFDHRMSQNFRMAEMAAGLDVLRDPAATIAQKHAALANLQITFPDCLWIGVAGLDGTIIASGDGRREGTLVKQEGWFIEGLHHPMISPLHQPTDIGLGLVPLGDIERVIDIARPLRDPEGNLIGVIDASVSWKWALEYRDLLLRNRNSTVGIDIMVTDSNGRILIGPSRLIDQVIGLRMDETAHHDGKSSMTSALQLKVSHWPDATDNGTGDNGAGDQGNYISAVGTGTGYQDFPGLGWNIVVRQPRDIAYAPAYAIRDQLIMVGIALAVLFAGIGWVIADRVTGSIRQLTRHARRLESGERGIVFPTGQGTREVAVLGEALHHLVGNLLQREQQLLDLNAHLESRIADRTALLAASNRQLEDEMAQRQAVEYEREALIKQLRDQAEHDSLTGALNRRAFLSMAERDRRRLGRDDGRIAVIMFDIDHFKRINDTYGHGAGDEVIRRIAATARQTVRDGDLLCRYGGEEFALLLSDPGADSAALVAERLRQEVAGLVFKLSRQGGAEISGTTGETEMVQVTISLGLTIASARNLREDGVVTLLDRADQALYAAKRSGRNCTMIDQQVISEFRAPLNIRARKDDLADKKIASADRSYGSLFPAAQVANDG